MGTKKHRATGKPKGRPRVLTHDFREKALAWLRKRLDPSTGLITPDWIGLSQALGVSRSTVARQMDILHQIGRIESVSVPISEKTSVIRYRLHGDGNTP